MLNKLKSKIIKQQRLKREQQVSAFVKKYIAENNLSDLLRLANEKSQSTGTDISHYVLLHSLIRKQKPLFVLECGTGKSTWVLAEALKKNCEEFGIKGKVISMENIPEWYEQAQNIFPEHLKPFAEIHYSPSSTYLHCFVKGTTYENIPDNPYEIVFVDGPGYTIQENGRQNITANMDFIKILSSSKVPMTAVLDYRLTSVIAYAILLGRKNVKFLKPWNAGIVENVTQSDLIVQSTPNYAANIELLQKVAEFKNADPSWIIL